MTLGLAGTTGACRYLKEEAVSAEPPSGKPLAQEDAVQRARAAAVGKVHIPDNAAAVVEQTPEAFVVTFPIQLPPGTRGADFYARIWIDRGSGQVTKMLAGH
jgi:hypothetical protein